MENNMKQFNLEEYLAHPERKVVTRDGREVRIICTDRKNHDSQPIIALVENDEDEEKARSYKIDGKWSIDGLENSFDLFFAPEKHEGWMNLYKKGFGLVIGDLVRDSEEAAKKIAAGDEDYITTIKVEWEE